MTKRGRDESKAPSARRPTRTAAWRLGSLALLVCGVLLRAVVLVQRSRSSDAGGAETIDGLSRLPEATASAELRALDSRRAELRGHGASPVASPVASPEESTSASVLDSERSAPEGDTVEAEALRSAALASDRPGSDALPADARLSGRVVDATGGPIAGARIGVTFEGRAWDRYRATGIVSTTPQADVVWSSDGEGKFQGLVPAGHVALAASADAYAPARKAVRAPADEVVLVLAPGGSVTGRVVREDGRPVSGARVRAQARGVDLPPLSTRSDAGGAFTIGGAPSGVLEVSASAAGYSTDSDWVRLGVGEASPPLVLTLLVARSVHGVVRVGGKPCTQGLLRLGAPLSPMTPIGAEGSYRIEGLLEGRHSLSARCTGGAPETRTIELSRDSPPSLALDWELGAGFSLTGSVRRTGGEPVAAARVTVLPVPPPEGWSGPPASDSFVGLSSSECVSDEAGAFVCGGLGPGWYGAAAQSAQGPGALSEAVRVDAESHGPVTVIVSDSGEIRVTIAETRAGGVPVQGVFARGNGPIALPAAARDGVFVFEHFPLGRYRVGLDRALTELGPSVVDVELSRPGQIIELQLTPPTALAIAGSVLDHDGSPLPDAWVKAFIAEPGMPMPFRTGEPVLTNLDGTFELTSLAPGRYVLAVTHSLGEARSADVPAGKRDVVLVVAQYGSLSGTVTLPDGQPAPSFSVLLLPEPLGDPASVAGERGAWSAPWLAPGAYRIAVMSTEGGGVAEARVESNKNATVAITLDPAKAGIGIQNALRRKP